MKRIVTVIALIFFSISGKAFGYDKNDFGIGLILGSPTGVSTKFWLSKDKAIDGAFAWSFGKGGRFQVHGDYLWHSFNIIKVEKGSLPLYYGIGFRINLGNEGEVGIRFPIGLEYLFPRAPFDVFLELVPVLQVIKETDFDIDGAVGVRFFFK